MGGDFWPLPELPRFATSPEWALLSLAAQTPPKGTVHFQPSPPAADISNYENILNAESCSDGDADSAVVAFLTGDWRLWAAWVGAVLVFSMANALLASAIPARKEVFGNMRQMEFRQRVAKRRDEESGDGPVNADDIQVWGGVCAVRDAAALLADADSRHLLAFFFFSWPYSLSPDTGRTREQQLPAQRLATCGRRRRGGGAGSDPR